MAKNRKTIYKRFSYLQCDDFAAYLSDMAAKGWHFKEWGVGLVFEKGEPEQTVYAVEVFYKGSDHDLTPSIETLDFADYCQKAGWQLVDSKQKYCIFKQIRQDAVPIVTPEERLENASRAYMRQLWLQFALAMIWICNIIFRFVPTNQFIDSIFSEITLIFTAYWVFYFLYTMGKFVWVAIWKHRAKKRCRNEEHAVLRNASERVWNLCSLLALVLFTLAYACVTEFPFVIVTVSIILILILMSVFLAKVRPDKETAIGIQVLVAVLICIVVFAVTAAIISASEEDFQHSEEFPLYCKDIGIEAGSVKDTFSTQSSSILGSKQYYNVYYEDDSFGYLIFESEHDWILDTIWKHHLTFARNATTEDCTALWDAETAYRNQASQYYVRYGDSILILSVFDDLALTEEQTAIIRNALGLEG